jgi:hypothetical protein
MKRSLGILAFAASAAIFVLSNHVRALAQDGNVVIYRALDSVGSVLKPSVYVDGRQGARLANGSYVSLRLAPGKHSFESSMKKSAVEVEVKSNQTVYLQMVIETGVLHGMGRLILATAAAAKQVLPGLRPLDANQTLPADATTPSPPPEAPAADNQPADTGAESGPPAQPASVIVKSTPPGADINVDGKFMGNTPSTIQLAPGEHQISIEKEGLRPWQRTMTVSPGGSITLDATLEKP